MQCDPRDHAMNFLVRSIVPMTLVAASAVGLAQEKHPVYVGSQVCIACHRGAPFGHQDSLWFLSAHARAFASLATPEAHRIAELSGIPVEPQQSPMCLGCHATGAEAEEWEKDPLFHLQEGVQCEKCHGPGSEYIDLETMTHHEAALRAGLVLQTPDDCLGCHAPKGSHDVVLRRAPFDLEAALRAMAHPSPKNWSISEPDTIPSRPQASPAAHYVGSLACAECHLGPERGYQYSKWRSSAHARAYADLATPRAAEIAREMNVAGDPQKDASCLKCHTSAHHRPAAGSQEGYSLGEGVGCEACHGAGSAYSSVAVMRNLSAARAAGLLETGEALCMDCHAQAHGKAFDLAEALRQIAHPSEPPKVVLRPRYLTPVNMAFRPNSDELYVTCEAAGCVAVVSTRQRRKLAEIPVGHQPQDVAFLPDGRRAFVSNRQDDTVSVIDADARKVVQELAVGDEPHGVLVSPSGDRLYVLNTSSDNISVFDTVTLQGVKHLAASRSPWSLALAPEGDLLVVTNNLSRFIAPRSPLLSELTLIDVGQARVDERVAVPGGNLMQGVAWHPSGRFALSTLNRTKSSVPMTRLMQGWTITNGLALLWRDRRVDQVLLDEPSLGFADPTDVGFTPDGKWALVTSLGTDRVAVVDVAKLLAIVEGASDEERLRVLPNHLGKACEFVTRHIPTPIAPRGIAVAPDGSAAYVATSLDDSVTVIDLASQSVANKIDLGGPKEMTLARYGERLFHNAKITFRKQYSCHSCHPDGHVDAITYDIESEGIGLSPVDNRTLRGIHDTAPFKWEGTNPSLSRQCGARLAVYFTRLAPFTPEELAAVDNYVCTIPRPPNRYRPLGAPLTEAQRRGKAMFERTRKADGSEIPKQLRCTTCHFPPLYTDRRQHDIGTQMELDRQGVFDTPHLNNIYDSAPYLHNGAAHTLEEIWTRFNPYDTHGVTNDMTKDQLNDLIEYLKTL